MGQGGHVYSYLDICLFSPRAGSCWFVGGCGIVFSVAGTVGLAILVLV